MEYTKPLARLIDEFQKFPGVGPKSAQRMAFFLLKQPEEDVKQFAESILEAKSLIVYCSICFNISSQEICEICTNSKRDQSTICVIADTKDLIALEKTREYNGVYHVLQGLISPLEGIGPDNLRITDLLKRLTSNISEVILAINNSVEGEATTLYLSKIIKPLKIKVTRIAFGLPVGSDLEYADEITLSKALEGRQEI
ncbi:MAG: recombination mediator RecR [Cyanobacteriota bacterium]